MASGWRFGKVWRVIRGSPRKIPIFTLQPVGRRVADFIWEVMLQGKVISQRPLPGLAHALVFWGFCVFALVTLNHFAEGLQLGFLDRSGIFGPFYFDLAAVFAIAVAVSIAGLAFRRFVIRPKWLGPLSPESGVIALLIFLLMVTYLATFVPGWESSRLLWWAHTLTILVFLPLIPHTKHLHLVLSPVTVFLKRDAFSKIPPLAGDEDSDSTPARTSPKLISLQAFTCVECGRCTEHCPATNTGKVLNPKEIALGVRGYLNEFGPAERGAAAGRAFIAGGRVPMHHLRVVRVSVPGGRAASADDHRPAARRGEHGQMGGRLRHQAVPESGAQRQRAGIFVQRARQIHPEAGAAASSTARRSIACGWAAWARTIRRAGKSSRRWCGCCAG